VCSGYSGANGTGIMAFFKDKAGIKPKASGGVNTGNYSGPTTAGVMGSSYVRRTNTAPSLDTDMLGSAGG
jgi:hypothetical protein